MSSARSLLRGIAAIVAAVAIGATGALAPPGDRAPAREIEAGRVVAARDDADLRAGARRASSAMARLELFRTGNGGATLVLGGEELTAVLRHALPGLVPAGVSDPVVGLQDGGVRLTARVSADAFSAMPLLVEVLGALPDTVDVEVRGTLASDLRGLSLRVDRMSVERLPLPTSMVASVLSSSSLSSLHGGEARSDAVGPRTLRLAWPRDLSGVRVWNDRLILERAEPTVDRVVDGGGGS